MRLKLSDMTPALRERVEKAINGGASRGTPLTETLLKSSGIKSITRKGPNKTEAEYNRVYLGGKGLYEAITLRLPGGSRYTPDWVTFECVRLETVDEQTDGTCIHTPARWQVTLHECKGAYRHASHGRALTAFRECVAAFPCFRFVWAVKESSGWKITAKECGK